MFKVRTVVTSGTSEFTDEVACAAGGYYYSNPAPLNTIQTISGTSPMSFSQTYTAEMSVKEIVRGAEAWSRLQAANMFNSPAPEGYEYILARIYFKVLDVAKGQTFDLNHAIIDLIPRTGRNMIPHLGL